jgi:predicted ribosome quality control (RQC) complex YloA/Tae2 family protein
LNNAISQRVFSLQNHIKGDRSTRMETITLDRRIRIASAEGQHQSPAMRDEKGCSDLRMAGT